MPLFLVGILLGSVASQRDSCLIVPCLAFVVLAVLTGIFVSARIVCPFCSEWIGAILRFGKSPFVRGLPRRIKHCPICGADFDSELKAKASANQAAQSTAPKVAEPGR